MSTDGAANPADPATGSTRPLPQPSSTVQAGQAPPIKENAPMTDVALARPTCPTWCTNCVPGIDPGDLTVHQHLVGRMRVRDGRRGYMLDVSIEQEDHPDSPGEVMVVADLSEATPLAVDQLREYIALLRTAEVLAVAVGGR